MPWKEKETNDFGLIVTNPLFCYYNHRVQLVLIVHFIIKYIINFIDITMVGEIVFKLSEYIEIIFNQNYWLEFAQKWMSK